MKSESTLNTYRSAEIARLEAERLRETQDRERDILSAAKASEDKARLEVNAARLAAQASEERARSDCRDAHSAACLSE